MYMHISLGAWPVWAEDEEDEEDDEEDEEDDEEDEEDDEEDEEEDEALTIGARVVCVCKTLLDMYLKKKERWKTLICTGTCTV